ncbi:MAG TPA: isochorismate synthase [Candidatus Binataceae bacterium]|nr:isochorismate synthase [Candidatus Binataceae bacterium]
MFDARSVSVETVAFNEPIDLQQVLRLRGGVPVFYWEHPERGVAIAAAGAAAEFTASGIGRLREISESARRALLALGQGSNAALDGRGPLAVGGFGFSDRPSAAPEWREFPSAKLVLPQLLWVRAGTRCTLTRIWPNGRRDPLDALESEVMAARPQCPRAARPALDIGPADDLEQRDWRARVERAQSQIIAKNLSKVVLSRRREIAGRDPFDPAAIIEQARATRPSCFNFCLRPGATSFVGSTPELLVRLERDRVVSGALAGSAPRGATEAEDRALGESLLASAKDREEHELVVSAVRMMLKTEAALSAGGAPQLVRLPEVQHLFTPIEGRLWGDRTVLEIASLLHPTPAVCGVPRELASVIIEREEPWRGWYTGAVGWMNARGEGEFAVALRAGLIDGRKFFLWAGAGIVRGSDPDAEFAETEIKMSALIRDETLGTAA